MSFVAIALLLIAAYLAIKLVGFAIRMAMIALVLVLAYWLLAPILGLPLP